MYLLPIECQETSLILAAVISGESDEYISRFTLANVGEQFVLTYSQKLVNLSKQNFTWENITSDFGEKIDLIWNNKDLKDLARQEMVKEMFTNLKQQTLDTLTAIEFFNNEMVSIKVHSMFT